MASEKIGGEFIGQKYSQEISAREAAELSIANPKLITAKPMMTWAYSPPSGRESLLNSNILRQNSWMWIEWRREFVNWILFQASPWQLYFTITWTEVTVVAPTGHIVDIDSEGPSPAFIPSNYTVSNGIATPPQKNSIRRFFWDKSRSPSLY